MRLINIGSIDGFLGRFSKPAVITSYDCEDPIIIACNKAHVDLTGYSELEVVGRNPKMFKGPLTTNSQELKEALIKNDFWYGSMTNYRKDGTSYLMQLVIVGIVIEGKKYYFALKSLK